MSFDKEGPEMLLLLNSFEAREVKYIIVGGCAVNRYGYNRATGDLDIYYCEIMMDDGMYADLMTDIPGLEKDKFDEYFAMATVDEIDGTTLRFLHYNHLLENKKATGRLKDQLDVIGLQRINSQ